MVGSNTHLSKKKGKDRTPRIRQTGWAKKHPHIWCARTAIRPCCEPPRQIVARRLRNKNFRYAILFSKTYWRLTTQKAQTSTSEAPHCLLGDTLSLAGEAAQEKPRPRRGKKPRFNIQESLAGFGVTGGLFLKDLQQKFEDLLNVVKAVVGGDACPRSNDLIVPQAIGETEDRSANRIEIKVWPDRTLGTHVDQNAIEQFAETTVSAAYHNFVTVFANAARLQSCENFKLRVVFEFDGGGRQHGDKPISGRVRRSSDLDALDGRIPATIKDCHQQPLLAAEVLHQLRFRRTCVASDCDSAGVFVSVLGEELLGSPEDAIMRREFGGRLHHYLCV